MEPVVHDYLIIGAGPAGLQMGHHLARAGRDVLILEAGAAPGTFFRSFPRHRTLISVNKVETGSDDPEINLRMDWNSLLGDSDDVRFTRYSDRYFPPADELVRYLEDFASRHRLPIRADARVVRVERGADQRFRLTDHVGLFHEARRLIVSTGVSASYVPDIPGIELAEQYRDVSIDPRDFKGQRILIIGKGNSAFETADNLIAAAAVIHVAGPRSIKMAWRTHYVGHLRAVNNNFLDTYQLKSQNALLDGFVERLERDQDGTFKVTFSFTRANEVKKDLRYHRVIVCTGFKFDASIFAPDCRPKLVHDDRFPDQTSGFESVNVPGLFFAGTLMQVRDWKKSTSGFIHGFRYGVRALHRMLESRYEGVEWPHRVVPAEPGALMEAVLARVNRSSALWQQFGFMCDSISVGGGRARYCEELPLDYARERYRGGSHFTISLEYGPDHDAHDPFDIEVARIKQDETARAEEGHYLHPVVRHYRDGELEATHHVTENLENDWTWEATHREPLKSFFARELGQWQPEVSLGAVSLADFEREARLRLDPVVYDYFAGGADDERTLGANEEAFRRIGLLPRVLRGAPTRDARIALLGCRSSMPVLLAPTAFHRLAHADGEIATARAAATAGVVMVASMASTVAIEEIAAAGGCIWFQLYLQADLAFTESIVRRAEAAACKALVVTVDSPVFGHRERDLRNGFLDLPEGLCCENMRERGATKARPIAVCPELGWDHLDWLRKTTSLPIVLKGILNPLDAKLAVGHGADGIIVSNHGGRQLDGAPAAIEALPGIVDAVGGTVPLLLDGGIRRGTDVIKALALGATAVAIGRPALWGLATAGQEGVAAVLALLRQEIDRALALCGCCSVAEVGRDLLWLPTEERRRWPSPS